MGTHGGGNPVIACCTNGLLSSATSCESPFDPAFSRAMMQGHPRKVTDISLPDPTLVLAPTHSTHYTLAYVLHFAITVHDIMCVLLHVYCMHATSNVHQSALDSIPLHVRILILIVNNVIS